jgi:RND family efflux transporter MFP subunit
MLTLACLVTVLVTWLFAHEGHAPLPSRGVQFDLARGLVILTAEAREALDVQTAPVQRGALPDTVLAYATLVAPWQGHTFASSRLSGRIVKLHARPGDAIRAGQVLAEVASLDLETLQLELLNARNDVRLAEKVLGNLESASDSVAEQTILDARTALEQHQGTLAVARSKWLALGLSADTVDALLRDGIRRNVTLPITSPIAGTIIQSDLNLGKVVEPGEPLFKIVDLSRIWVQIGLLEQDLHKIRIGQSVELRLTAYPGEMIPTRIQVKGLALESLSHLATVWADLTNPPGKEPRFLPGMSGQVHIVLPASEKSWTIPTQALIDNGVERYVFIEESRTAEASEFRKKPVVVVRQTPDAVEIQSSQLVPGDRVATVGSHELGGYFIPEVLKLSPEAITNLGVKVAPAGRHAVEEVVSVDGHVDIPLDRRSAVSAQLGGNLLRLHVDRGQLVRPGQLLAELLSLEFQNLQLDLLKEHLTFQLLDRQETRLRKLGGVVPAKRLQELEAAVAASRNRRNSLRKRLEVIGLSTEQITNLLERKQLVEAIPVRATIAGHVVDFARVLGQSVKTDEIILHVHDLTNPLIVGFVAERDLPRVRIGQHARVRLVSDPERVLTGKVVRSARVFSREDQTLSVWVELHTVPEQLRHNQLARLSLTAQTFPSMLAIPRSAVVLEGTNAHVFVRKEDDVFERKRIGLGREDDRWVEVVDGLNEGEPIVVRGAAGLQTAHVSVR